MIVIVTDWDPPKSPYKVPSITEVNYQRTQHTDPGSPNWLDS